MIYTHHFIPKIHAGVRQFGGVNISTSELKKMFLMEPLVPTVDEIIRMLYQGYITGELPPTELKVKPLAQQVEEFCREHNYLYKFDVINDTVLIYSPTYAEPRSQLCTL